MIPPLKDQFPQTQDICYLNHAAVSPWPKCAAEALQTFAEENVLRGAQYYPEWLQVEKNLRENLRRLINASSTREIALAKNTSEALSIIAYGLTWQAGDEVIISQHEFPSNRIVWESLKNQGVKMICVDIRQDNPLEALSQAITPATRLISVSSVQYADGLSIDLIGLGQLCRKHDILLCIDAIQSLGAIPFDQQRVQADFVVADGHKWLMAAEGLALLYIKSCHIEKLKLNQFGWHMVANRGNYDTLSWQPASDATRFECGSPNMLGIHVLNASLALILSIGVDHIHQQLKDRCRYLILQLDTLPGLRFHSDIHKIESGIVNFSISGKDSSALHQALMQRGVICAHRGGGIRFSPHFYTPEETLKKAVEILKQCL
jgi:selenocysteine lyase/cysteine desulfurase